MTVGSRIPYTFPLRPDFLVRVVLPFDLTAAEAERLVAFIRAIAFDDGRDSAPHP